MGKSLYGHLKNVSYVDVVAVRRLAAPDPVAQTAAAQGIAAQGIAPEDIAAQGAAPEDTVPEETAPDDIASGGIPAQCHMSVEPGPAGRAQTNHDDSTMGHLVFLLMIYDLFEPLKADM